LLRHSYGTFELGDLEDEIKRGKRANHWWEEKDLWEILRCLIEALDSLQSRKICHREIKPQNIFMGHQNVYKIGDFGVSKSEIMNSSSHKTIVGTLLHSVLMRFSIMRFLEIAL
jgi:aurora kinase